MNETENDLKASKRHSRSLYLSLISGAIAWALILLRLTPLLGDGFGSIFFFVPLAFFGFGAGIISLVRSADKKMAYLAIAINSLAIGVLILIMVLLMNSHGFSFNVSVNT